MEAVKELLEKAKSINEEYTRKAKDSGENFNIFRILKLERSEVRMHSAFLAELFRSNGTHELKNDFLKEFIELIKETFSDEESFLKRVKKFDIDKDYCVDVEYHTGFINELGDQGGRIDIKITNNLNHNNAIIIENKIDANDQEKQLIRYNESCKNVPILYLTLFGNKPSTSSAGAIIEGDNYVCISYKEHIVKWI